MRNLSILVLGCAWAAFGAAAAYGQAAEASLSMGAGILKNNDLGSLGVTVNGVEQRLSVGNGFRLSARLSLNTWEHFGHEFGYGYNHTSLQVGTQGSVGMGVHQGFYDFMVYATPTDSKVRPFVCGGGGFASFFPPGSSAFSGNGITKFSYNYGGGVKAKVTSIYGVRFDIRDYVTGKPFGSSSGVTDVHGLLHNVEVSAGFEILF